jgi:transposase
LKIFTQHHHSHTHKEKILPQEPPPFFGDEPTPMNRDSGKYKGKRAVWGGRARIRSVLYMCVISGIRFNPKIKAFYEKLRNAGKSHKVAATACMRKLMIILNTMVKNNTCWEASGC